MCCRACVCDVFRTRPRTISSSNCPTSRRSPGASSTLTYSSLLRFNRFSQVKNMSSFRFSRLNIMLAASSGKRNITWRPSVCPSVPSAYSPWLTRRQHATRPQESCYCHRKGGYLFCLCLFGVPIEQSAHCVSLCLGICYRGTLISLDPILSHCEGQGHRSKFTVARYKYSCCGYGCTLRCIFVVRRVLCAKVAGATSVRAFYWLFCQQDY